MRTSFLFKSALCAALLLAGSVPCLAVLTVEGATVSLTNADDFLLEAAVGREAVKASLAVQVANPGATGGSIEVESTFTLVEYVSGLPVALQTTPAGSEVVVTDSLMLGPGMAAPLFLPAALRPTAGLDPAKSYRVVASVRSREVGGMVWSAAVVYTGAWRKWVHFTNTTADDASLNVKAFTGAVAVTDRQILKSVAGQETFTATVAVVLHRYDIESVPQAAAQVPVTFQLNLVQDDVAHTVVPLAVPTVTVQRSLLARQAVSPETPVTDAWTETITFAPAPGAVILPTADYFLEVTVAAAEPDLTPIPATPAVAVADKARFLVLSGALSFGGVQTIFTALGNDPSPLMVLSGGIYSTQLAVTQGTAQAAPARRYGDGTLLDVSYDPVTGNAEVTSGTQNLTTTESDFVAVNGLRLLRGVIRLNQDGARLEIGAIYFPAGFGVSTAQNSRRHQPGLTLVQEPLDSGLGLPFATKMFTPPAGSSFYYAFCDRLPVRLRTSAITWRVNEGTFVFAQTAAGAPGDPGPPVLARHSQEESLAALALLPGAQNAEPRASNDAYLKNITDLSTVEIGMGASGQALLTVSLNLGAGQMQTHYPQGVTLSWSGGVFAVVQNGVQAASFLTAQAPVTVSYKRDCDAGCTATAGNGQFVFTPTDWTWRFTPDGGVRAEGSTLSERLRWGTTELSGGGSPPEGGSAYAMQTSQWSAGVFHAPGNWLAGAAAPGVTNPTQRPEALLLSGVLADGSYERPASQGYRDGLGDYAGLNLRVGAPGAKTGRSVLAGFTTADYDLKARNKYYVRASGVTGIHEAVALIPSTLFMYGFAVNFDGLRLAYRDGLNVDSETGGVLHVDSPVQPLAGFDLAFKHMLFKCQGQPSRMELATEGEVKTLAYWGTNIVPLAVEFAQPVSAVGCVGVDEGFLLLSVETSFPSVTPQKLHATLGFMANGNLVTKANPLSTGLEVDSRFTLPPNIDVVGAGGVPWQVTVVGKAYLNNPVPTYPAPPPSFTRPSQGFLTFPATMNLPWFQDMKVQLHVSSSAGANSSSVMHIMGGWPADPKNGQGKGWKESGQTFFTNKLFDPDHVGFDTQLDGTATVVDVATYRDPPQESANAAFVGDPYRPLAEKLWLDVVDFRFPLKWETVKRRFLSYEQRADIIVLGQMHRQVKSLTPSTTELTFGAQLSIPRINTQNLVGEVTEGLTGALADGIADAATAALGPLLTPLMSGMAGLDQLLSERYDAVLSGPLAAEVDAMSNNLIGEGVPLNDLKAELRSRLTTMQPEVWAAVNSRLGQGQTGVGAARGMLAAGSSGDFHLVGTLVKELLKKSDVPDVAALVETTVDTALAQLLPEISPDLAQADEALTRVLGAMNTAQTRLENQVFAVFQETKPALDAAANLAVDEINSEKQKPGWELLSHTARQERVRRLVQERVLGSTMVPKLQLIVRQHVQDSNELFRAAFDDVLGQVNHLVRGVIKKELNNLGDDVRNEAVGKMGEAGDGEGKGKLAGINIEGYAQINDESLRVLDINGKFEFNVPDSLSLQAHLRYEERNENTPAAGCRTAPGDKAATITINAKAQCDWVGTSGPTVVTIGSRFTLINGVPMGFDGSFGFKGNVTLGPVAVKEIGLVAGFGTTGTLEGTWAYLGGFGRGEYGGHEAAAGIFLGRTCDLSVLKMVDLTAHVALSNSGYESGPITGVYFYGEAWFPLNEVFGIPSTCMLTLKAGGGSGFFGFVSKVPVNGVMTDKLFVGCKQAYGVEGTVLCALEARGSITILGSISITPPDIFGGTETGSSIFGRVLDPDIILGGSYIIRGDAEFSLTFGYCPACLELSKHLGVMWKLPKSLTFDF